jgi:hypothetical protein
MTVKLRYPSRQPVTSHSNNIRDTGGILIGHSIMATMVGTIMTVVTTIVAIIIIINHHRDVLLIITAIVTIAMIIKRAVMKILMTYCLAF